MASDSAASASGVQQMDDPYKAGENERLRAENERLRAVLVEAKGHISALRDEVMGMNEDRPRALAMAVWFTGQEHTQPATIDDALGIANRLVTWLEKPGAEGRPT